MKLIDDTWPMPVLLGALSLGGLAAGLGLAWLASSLGLGEAFGQFMVIALLVLLAMMVFGWIMRSRRPAATAAAPYAFQGAGAGEVLTPKPAYRPENVGNDASARPFERSAQMGLEAAPAGSGIVIGSASAVQSTVESRARGEAALKGNAVLMDLLAGVKPGSTFWMVGDQSLLAGMPTGSGSARTSVEPCIRRSSDGTARGRLRGSPATTSRSPRASPSPPPKP